MLIVSGDKYVSSERVGLKLCVVAASITYQKFATPKAG
jgi:hypothetical protein